jgi:cytoskeletal protein CcmA (bactofilin family)
MWKKDEAPAKRDDPHVQVPAQRLDGAPRTDRSAAVTLAPGRATIGRSITIKGEVTGDEDLVIQGHVEGSVDLKQHSVTVGPEGEVRANIRGRIVTIEGRVHGGLSGNEQVILRSSASVEGDIAAPRVVLEDGAHFRGGVDMGEAAGAKAAATGALQGTKAPEPNGAHPSPVEASLHKMKSPTDNAAKPAGVPG